MSREPWPDEDEVGRADGQRGCLVLGLGVGLLVTSVWAVVRLLGFAD